MRGAVLICLALTLAGCKDVSMREQNKLETYGPSALWPDGKAARPLPDHVVAQGDLARDASMAGPPKATPELLARGRERFDIFCAPCHGAAGYGDGVIVSRGFPHPPSFQEPRLRAASAQHVFDVITNGYGVMYPYGSRVPVADRWAIVAYVRALQMSQQASATSGASQ
jgi:mono/diheme cytochrome c family protein